MLPNTTEAELWEVRLLMLAPDVVAEIVKEEESEMETELEFAMDPLVKRAKSP